MKRIYFNYLPINLDRRGLYHPCHTIYVKQLIGKAEVKDESNSPIETPNTLLNFGYVEISDETIYSDLEALLILKGKALGIDIMSAEEAKQMLIENGYVESEKGFLIREGSDMESHGYPAEYLVI